MNSYYNDDLLQRMLILWVMALMVLYGNNAPLVDEEIGALRSTVAAYMVARVSCSLAHLMYSFSCYQHRRQQRLWVGISLFSMCIYIPLYFESVSIRGKIAAAAVAMAFEELGWNFSVHPLAKRLLRTRYSTAVDINHEVDRFAAFYIIVLGEFVLRIILGSPAAIGLNDRLLRAVWTLIIAFCLNWLYLHADGSLDMTHPMRHSAWTAIIWVAIHIPLTGSLVAGGHIAAATTGDEEFEVPQRWLLCGGLGTGMLCLWVLAMIHGSKDEPGMLMLSKVCRCIQ